ncbi:MAG: DEAD/DEAH box helicase, partial [Alphaproteobacteria bacterium]|nr:DEAD/DEAH box helicase [Alphaproteobacteria bacterium]
MQTPQPTNTPSPDRGRPFALDPLFRRITELPGIGPRLAKLFEKLCGGDKVLDVLWHRPIDIIDRRFAPSVADAPPGHVATLTVRIESHKFAPRRNLPTRVHCLDATAPLDLVFFNARRDYIEKLLPIGATVVISGKVDHYNGRAQIVHPDAIGAEEDRAQIETIEPVYPLSAGLTNKTVRKAVHGALAKLPELPEWQDPGFKSQNKFPDWADAVRLVHTPPGANGLDPHHPARARLAYDELLAGQLALALVRMKTRKQKGRAFAGNGALRNQLLKALPFALTGAQQRSLEEIYADMGTPLRMLRLLQGDVGSGKTVVAAMAMLNAVECGAQAAIMAPTEILARQHAETLQPWLAAAGLNAVILTGRNKGKERAALLQQIKDGSAHIIIGTHALFQDEVEFHDLGLAVIDEQHRFGVHQR